MCRSHGRFPLFVSVARMLPLSRGERDPDFSRRRSAMLAKYVGCSRCAVIARVALRRVCPRFFFAVNPLRSAPSCLSASDDCSLRPPGCPITSEPSLRLICHEPRLLARDETPVSRDCHRYPSLWHAFRNLCSTDVFESDPISGLFRATEQILDDLLLFEPLGNRDV